MYFDIYDKEKSITSLINKYGSDNILEVGEHYDGYALLHDGQCNHLIRMNAHIETTYEENDKKKFYISYQTDKYGKIIGYAKKLWNFGIKEYEIFCSSDIAKTIRKKLIDAAISGKTIQITNDEADVITKVFGPFAKAIKISEIYEENKDH